MKLIHYLGEVRLPTNTLTVIIIIIIIIKNDIS